LMVNLYDVLIFPPLWVEKLIRNRARAVEESVFDREQEVEISPQKETI
jgi:hypothetical protein